MPLDVIIRGKTIHIEDSERVQCEIWTRVMGYYRPVSEFNIGKVQEFKDRVSFIERGIDGNTSLP